MESGTSVTSLQRDTGERFVPLRRELGVSSFGINQIVLQPGQRMRIHRHASQEEVYVVLAGTLTLMVEGEAAEHGPDAADPRRPRRPPPARQPRPRAADPAGPGRRSASTRAATPRRSPPGIRSAGASPQESRCSRRISAPDELRVGSRSPRGRGGEERLHQPLDVMSRGLQIGLEPALAQRRARHRPDAHEPRGGREPVTRGLEEEPDRR